MGSYWSKWKNQRQNKRSIDFCGIIVPSHDVQNIKYLHSIAFSLPALHNVTMWRHNLVLHGTTKPTEVVLLGWINAKHVNNSQEPQTTQTCDIESSIAQNTTIPQLRPHIFREEDKESIFKHEQYAFVTTRLVSFC